MLKTHKTAIAIPDADFERMEFYRKKTGQSRSRLLVVAFQAWVGLQKTAEQERLYEEGYRRNPENPKDVEGGMKAGLTLWEKDAW
jgi:hypothetical protein